MHPYQAKICDISSLQAGMSAQIVWEFSADSLGKKRSILKFPN